MTDGLSPADRARVVSELNETAFNLNVAVVVLEQAGAGAAAGMVEAAATQVAAACCMAAPVPKAKTDPPRGRRSRRFVPCVLWSFQAPSWLKLSSYPACGPV
jgi:hypothetical protein